MLKIRHTAILFPGWLDEYNRNRIKDDSSFEIACMQCDFINKLYSFIGKWRLLPEDFSN